MNELYSTEFWQQCPTAAAAAGFFYGHSAGGVDAANDVASAPYLNAAAAAAAAVAAPYLPLDAALAPFGHHNTASNNNVPAEHRQQPPPADNSQTQLFSDGKYFGATPTNVIVSDASTFSNLHHFHNTFFGHGFGPAASVPFSNSLFSLGLGAATRATAELPLPYPSLNLFNPQQQTPQQQQHDHHCMQQQLPGNIQNSNNNNSHRHIQHTQQQAHQHQQLLAPSAIGGVSAADLLDLGHQHSRQAAVTVIAELKPGGKSELADERKRALSGQENQNNNASNHTTTVSEFRWASNNNNNNSDIPAGDHISAESLKPITIPFVSCQKSKAENGTLLSPSNYFHHPHSNKQQDHDNCGNVSTLVAQTCQACLCAQSNGLHFGAKTCAACAAFFRRSVSDNKIYQCKRSQRCVIKPGDTNGYRKMCRACRMQRCLKIGMQSANVQNKRHRRDFYFGDGFTLTDGNVLPHPVPTLRQHAQPHQQEKQQQQYRQQLHSHAHNTNFNPVQQTSQRTYGSDGGANAAALNNIFARMNPTAAPPAAANASLFSAMPSIPFSMANDSNIVINHGLHDLLQHHGGAIAPAAPPSLFGGADELIDIKANKSAIADPPIGYGKPESVVKTSEVLAPRQGVIIAPTHFHHSNKPNNEIDAKKAVAMAKKLALSFPDNMNCIGPINNESRSVIAAKPVLQDGLQRNVTASPSIAPLRESWQIPEVSMLEFSAQIDSTVLQPPPVTSSWLTPSVAHKIAIENSGIA